MSQIGNYYGILGSVFNLWRVGHVYRVRKQWRRTDKFTVCDYYYCTILHNMKSGFGGGCKYVTYVPNLFTRPLDNGCELDSRLSYVGTFEEYGHLLFNRKTVNYNSGENEFNTVFKFKNYADTIHTITPKI